MIDPVEAMLNLFRADAALVAATGGRIAVQHKYALDDNARGTAWPTSSPAVCVIGSGDVAATTAGMLTGRVLVYAFAPTPFGCAELWSMVDAICRIDVRRNVSTSRGTALIYSTELDTSPTPGVDSELTIAYGSGGVRYRIATDAV